MLVGLLGFKVAVFEVHGGGLQGVEEKAGALIVDGAGGDVAGDLLDGGLDGVGIFEEGEFEPVGGEEAGFFVVEAELTALHGGGEAAETVGADVLATGRGVGLDEADGVGLRVVDTVHRNLLW